MPDEIELVVLPLEVGGNHPVGIYGRDAEGNEGRRYIDVLEGSAHRVLASD